MSDIMNIAAERDRRQRNGATRGARLILGIYDRNIQQFSYAIYHFAGWRFTFTSNFRNGLGDVYFCHDQFF